MKKPVKFLSSSDPRMKAWISLELFPEEYIKLLEDMINFINRAWEGDIKKLPKERPKLCQFMENDCQACIKHLGLDKPCYDSVWDPKGKCVAKENGWSILDVTNTQTPKLPNKTKTTHKLVFDGLVRYYTHLAKSIKRNHIENLIEVKLYNNDMAPMEEKLLYTPDLFNIGTIDKEDYDDEGPLEEHYEEDR